MTASALPGRFDRTLPVTGAVRLDVALDCGSIRIKTGVDRAVQVSGVLRARQSLMGWGDAGARIRDLEANPPVEQIGDTIRVGFISNSWFTERVILLLDIVIPAQSAVRAEADSGDITIDGVRGPVDCRTDSGDIELSDIDGPVRAEADSGRIRITRVTGSVYARTDSGNIEALEVAGPIEARADSGSIRLSQTAPAAVRAQADSGQICVRLAAGCGYNVRARAGSGTVHAPQILRCCDNAVSEVIGQIGPGGPSVDLVVDSGTIEIE